MKRETDCEKSEKCRQIERDVQTEKKQIERKSER
jgi:hypothetical protein